MKYIFVLFISILTFSCSENKLETFYFMDGTWQVEGKQQFEKWKISGGELLGVGYKLVDGKKQTLENLSIKEINGKIVYQATVANQNDGASISFGLNEEEINYFSFENLEHDFPKKIQYQKIDNNRLKVSVLGENDKGFTFFLHRNEN